MNQKKRIDLLLLGKTGNGKSATGNTILRRKAFESSASSSSVTKRVSEEVSEYKEIIIKVVDGPGIGDTRLDDEAGMNLIMEEMQTAIQLNPNGYHAFVLVIRFGTRITKEDGEAVELLKTTFGPNFVRKHCILLFTHGDIFENSSEENGKTFQQWYRSQEGTLKDVIEECGERVLLFDNRSEDQKKIFDQIDSLLLQVENLLMQGNRYRDEHFEKAKDAREKAKVLAKEPQIREETSVETSLIFQKLDQIQKTVTLQDKLQPLEELKSRTDALCDIIEKNDNGTGALQKLAKTAESLKQAVYNEADITKRLIEDDKKRKAEEKKQREEREASDKKFMEQHEALKLKMDEDRKEYEEKRKVGEQTLREEREASEKKLMEQQEEMKRKMDNDRNTYEGKLADGEKRHKEEREASEKKFREQQEAIKREMDDYRKEYEAKLADGEIKSREERENFEKKLREQEDAMKRKMDESKKEYEARVAKDEKRQRKEREEADKRLMDQQQAFERRMAENKMEYQAMIEKQNKERKAEKKKHKEELAKREQEMREKEARLREEAERHRNEARMQEKAQQAADMAWQRKLEEMRIEQDRRFRQMEEMHERQRREADDRARSEALEQIRREEERRRIDRPYTPPRQRPCLIL